MTDVNSRIEIKKEGRAVDTDYLARIEGKLDELRDAVTKLIIFEERQAAQGKRIGDLEERVAANAKHTELTEKKLDKWIQRGVGVWAVVVFVGSIVAFFWDKVTFK